jgi:hypothetical protein
LAARKSFGHHHPMPSVITQFVRSLAGKRKIKTALGGRLTKFFGIRPADGLM